MNMVINTQSIDTELRSSDKGKKNFFYSYSHSKHSIFTTKTRIKLNNTVERL